MLRAFYNYLGKDGERKYELNGIEIAHVSFDTNDLPLEPAQDSSSHRSQAVNRKTLTIRPS